MFCRSSSRCCGLVCSVWLWYFLIILIYFFKDIQCFVTEKQSNLLTENANEAKQEIYVFRVTQPYLKLHVKPRNCIRISGKCIILCILKGISVKEKVPTLPKYFRPFSIHTLLFSFGLIHRQSELKKSTIWATFWRLVDPDGGQGVRISPWKITSGYRFP